MDGRNSFGRRISLLNEDGSTPRLTSVAPSLGSRTSSHSSTPCLSPETPQLVRSDSSDSTSTMQTPSPVTPDFSSFDNLAHATAEKPGLSPTYLAAQNPLFPASAPAYPAPPQANSWAYDPAAPAGLPAQPEPAVFRSSLSPGASDRRVSNSSASKPAKKNQYPCPMAKQFNCHDYFTTSGHAARHAKKHTGKKDAFCPECNKAFTRKDNMEQHRRTHQNGRAKANGEAPASRSRAKQQAKRPKPAPLLTEPATPQAPLPMVDPSLPISPASSFSFSDRMAPAVQPAQPYGADFLQQSPFGYPDPSPYPSHLLDERNAQLSPGFSIASGLDTLAMAASDEKRKFDV